jgi:hypothetical protein
VTLSEETYPYEKGCPYSLNHNSLKITVKFFLYLFEIFVSRSEVNQVEIRKNRTEEAGRTVEVVAFQGNAI